MKKTISATALLLALGSNLALLPLAHAGEDMSMDKPAAMKKDMHMDKNMGADMKNDMKNDMHMEMKRDAKMGDNMMKDDKHDNKM